METTPKGQQQRADYVVIAHFRSRAMFAEGQTLSVDVRRPKNSPLQLQYTTRYRDLGFEARVPDAIHVEAAGSFTSLEDAIEDCADKAGDFLSVLSVIANAWRGAAEVGLGYDNTSRPGDHDFTQVYIPEQPFDGIIPERYIPLTETKNVVSALEALGSRRERLMRAAAQYVEALGHWKPGDELLAVNYLFMGMEAVAPLALQCHLVETGFEQRATGSKLGPPEEQRWLLQMC